MKTRKIYKKDELSEIAKTYFGGKVKRTKIFATSDGNFFDDIKFAQGHASGYNLEVFEFEGNTKKVVSAKSLNEALSEKSVGELRELIKTYVLPLSDDEKSFEKEIKNMKKEACIFNLENISEEKVLSALKKEIL